MRRNYATLFDSRYLAKGLVMLESLIRESIYPPTIQVLAMDKACERALRRLGITGVTVHSLEDFEGYTNTAALRMSRTWTEYCWTLASIFTDEVAHFVSSVTYLDADLMFFSDPEIIFDEIDWKSIGITPHRFSPSDAERLLKNGKFNVQWVTCSGDIGRACLKRWADQCREWCYYRNENGKFGDQKFLDEWPSLYPGEVREIENPGAGLAPWNMSQFEITQNHGRVFVNNHSLVFFHYHESDIAWNEVHCLTKWPTRECERELIYKPYVKAIREKLALVGKVAA